MIMQYLKATKTLDIIYDGKKGDDLIIKSYLDSDQVGDNKIRKSISRFIFIVNRRPVNQCSKKQPYY